MTGRSSALRPKVMTVARFSSVCCRSCGRPEPGADVMKRIAAPMIGGIATSFILELLIYPSIYLIWKWHSEVKGLQAVDQRSSAVLRAWHLSIAEQPEKNTN